MGPDFSGLSLAGLPCWKKGFSLAGLSSGTKGGAVALCMSIGIAVNGCSFGPDMVPLRAAL
jgi:hypothetical protein